MLLEEIDRPGEWYLDRGSGILYLYPPADPDEAIVEIGMLSAPMVVMDGVADVHLEGLTFDLPSLSPERDGRWHRFIDTSLPAPDDIAETGTGRPILESTYPVGPKSLVLLIAPVSIVER